MDYSKQMLQQVKLQSLLIIKIHLQFQITNLNSINVSTVIKEDNSNATFMENKQFMIIISSKLLYHIMDKLSKIKLLLMFLLTNLIILNN